MNRTTLLALAGFVLLLGAVLALRYVPRSPEEPKLALAGWGKVTDDAPPAAPDAGAAPADAGAAAPIPGLDEPKEELAPIDRIEITRKGQTIVLEQKGDDKKDWTITAPIVAKADYFKVRGILGAFEKPIESVHGKAVQPDDLGIFRLDEPNRIGVKLSEAGKPFAEVVVGGTERTAESTAATDPGVADTWVMKPGEDGRAYRMPGVDLRSPLDVELSALRSKKVLDEKAEAVTRLVLENPDDTAHPRIVLVREEKPADAPKDEGARPEEPWRFEEPKGFRPGGVTTFVSSAVGLYATEYLPADHAEGAKALASNVATLTLETAKGTTVLEVAAPDDKVGYVRVKGRDEIVQVSSYSAAALRKSLGDLRDKRVFDLATDAVTGLALNNEKGELAVRLVDGRWTADLPAGLTVGKRPVDDLVRDVTSLTVTRYLGNLPASETGLDAPTRRVTLQAAGGVHTLLLGKEKEQQTYGRLEGSGEVFEMASFVAKKLDKSAEDLRDKKVFAFVREDVTRIELASPGETTPVTIERRPDGDDWLVTAPEAIDAPHKPPITTIVSTLVNLEAKSRVADKTPAQVGLEGPTFTATVVTKDGARHTLFVSEQKDGTDVYARTDEPRWAGQVFTITDFQAQNLQKRPADLKPPK